MYKEEAGVCASFLLLQLPSCDAAAISAFARCPAVLCVVQCWHHRGCFYGANKLLYKVIVSAICVLNGRQTTAAVALCMIAGPCLVLIRMCAGPAECS